jgi:nucleotide-binding universal stress UspA family protein
MFASAASAPASPLEANMAFAPKKILVCTDFSDAARAAADAALDLAKLTGATLQLVYVIPLSAFIDFAEGLGQTASWTADVHASVAAAAGVALEKEAQRLSSPTLKVKFVKAEGPPQVQVAELAEREQVDLVVVGSHGRTGLQRVLLGSVAAGIVQHCRCAVLVIHAH